MQINKIIVIERPNWSVGKEKFSALKCKNILFQNIYISLLMLIVNRIFYKNLILPSHLGSFNRFLIDISKLIYKKVFVLDDGNYSFKQPNWLLEKTKRHKNLYWLSHFFKDNTAQNLYSFSLYNPQHNQSYENMTFLLLPDFEGLGVSYQEELEILTNILKTFAKTKLIAFPHRRGRFKLYEKLNINTKTDINCFEDWYLSSSFKNCKIVSSPSSAVWVLQDKRVSVLIMCKKQIKLTHKENLFYRQFGEI